MKINPEILSIAAAYEKDRGYISIPFLQMKMKISYEQAEQVIKKLKADKEDS